MTDEWDQMCGGSWEDEHSAKEREHRRMNEYGTIVNPSAVGNPDESPVVQLSPSVARLFNRCERPSATSGHSDGKCGGVNGFHADDCERTR